MVSIDISEGRRPISVDRVRPAPRVLFLIVLTAAGALTAVGLLAGVPNTFGDEATYVELARHLGASGRFEILGVPFPALTYGPAYVALLAPIFRLSASAREAYVVTRGLNAVVFATAAIPTFRIALRAVSRRTALVVAGVAIALPAGSYAAKVMTESLAYPVVLWCALAALRVVERPTRGRQVLLLLSVILASAVRFEFLVLAPALGLACLAGGDGSVRARCKVLAPLLLGTAGVMLGALGLLRATSGAGAGAGMHGFDAQGFSIVRFGALVLGSLGALDLYSGVIPFAAAVIVAVGIRRRASWVTSGLRNVSLIAGSVGLALLLTGSVYLATVPEAARPGTPPDRYTFYVVPLLFVAFAAWIEADGIRVSHHAAVSILAAALPVAAAMLIVGHTSTPDLNGLGFLPWVGLKAAAPFLWLLILAGYCGFSAFLLNRRSGDPHALIRPVMAVVTLTSMCAYLFVGPATVYSPAPGWLDAHTRPGVIAVWTGTPPPIKAQGLWEIAVGNRNLSAVYFTHTPDMFGQRVERRVTEQADGMLTDRGTPITARYVLTTTRTRIVGTMIARSEGFAIYRVQRTVRVAHSGVGSTRSRAALSRGSGSPAR